MAHGATFTHRFLQVSESDLSATAKTATFNSDKEYVGEYDYIGIALTTASVTGTSPTLDVKLQLSWDDGSNWNDYYPDDANSETQAALAQSTAATATMEMWPAWVKSVTDHDGNKPCIRFVFTIGGTNPSFTITARLVARSFGK